MESNSDDDRLTDFDDFGSASDFDDADEKNCDNHASRRKIEFDDIKEEKKERSISSSQISGNGKVDVDNSQPMLEKAIKGYSTDRLLNIIVGETVSRKNICQRVPRGVRHHAAYVVDTTYLEANIVSYGDDNGSWTGYTKPRRKYYIEFDDDSGMTMIREIQSKSQVPKVSENNNFTLCRNYFRHAHTPEF